MFEYQIAKFSIVVEPYIGPIDRSRKRRSQPISNVMSEGDSVNMSARIIDTQGIRRFRQTSRRSEYQRVLRSVTGSCNHSQISSVVYYSSR